MYLSVPGPPPPPAPSGWCKTLKLGCPPPPAPPNPDSLVGLYAGLQAELPTPGDQTGSTNSSTVTGLGCAGAGCQCGGQCKQQGMGLFDTGMNVSGWGMPEWGIVGLSAVFVWSLTRSPLKGSSKRMYRHRRAV